MGASTRSAMANLSASMPWPVTLDISKQGRPRSAANWRKRATPVRFEDVRLYVASLADIIRSKKAAGRARDLAVLPLLEKAIEQAEEAERHPQSPTRGSQERE